MSSKLQRRLPNYFLSLLLSCVVAVAAPVSSALAADHPAPVEGSWVAPSFTFHNGQSLPNLKLSYLTLGEPSKPAVLVLHGTYQTAAAMVSKDFGGQLFGPGQPLDASKYFIIIPDGIGVGKSSKPSDGLRAAFPQYNYADLVLAQYRMVTEGLGIKHLRLIIGNSMGGMQTWLWGGTYPGFADALVPMASQPTEMASRNWMMRRLLVESIKQDPAYANGNYTTQPPSLRLANAMFRVATNGGTLAYQDKTGSHAKADKFVDDALAAPVTGDANDFIYQWGSSGDYDAMPGLDKIKVPVLAINSADDERNPPETGVMPAVMKQLPKGQLLLIPASAQTAGHGTTGSARFYAGELGRFVEGVK